MSTLPPPPPGNPNFSTPSNITNQFSTSSTGKISGKPRSASVLPLIVGFAAIAVSILLYTLQSNDPTFNVVAYFLTPILVVLCLGIDTILQRKGLHDPWFSPKPTYSFLLRVIVFISFVVALPHIYKIAQFVGEWAAELI